MYNITSPATGFTGRIGPVQFVQGKATTDHEGVVAYCRRHGYTVEEVAPALAEETETPAAGDQGDGGGGFPVRPQSPPPARSAAKGAWVEYAVASGVAPAEADALTRDQLVARFHPETEGTTSDA